MILLNRSKYIPDNVILSVYQATVSRDKLAGKNSQTVEGGSNHSAQVTVGAF